MGGNTSLRLRRITERWTRLGAGRRRGMESDGAEEPGEAEADRGEQRGAAGAVDRAGPAADELRPQSEREALHRGRDAAEQQRREGATSGA